MNAQTEINMDAIGKVRDLVRGTAAAGAVACGWNEEQAVVLASKAEQSTVSRIVSGVAPEAALRAAIAEADLIVAIDLFAKTYAECGDAQKAFDAVAAVKAQATNDLPNGDKIALAASREFTQALERGFSPCAALASAYSTAGSVSRLIAAGGEG